LSVATSASSEAHRPPDPFAHAADIFDPPAWEAPDRDPLEPHQLPPPGRWDLWLLEAGRGAGKTEACSRYFARYMREHPGHRGRIIAPTFGDAVEACITGPSGLKSVDPEITWLPSAPGGAKVVWPNRSEALVIGTPFPKDVDRLRAGGNRHIDWWEEMAANTQLKEAWDQADFGLRLGAHPHSIASSTPRTVKAYREIRGEDGTVLTHGTIHDNPHLPEAKRQRLIKKYAGTRLGRQELEGKLLEDVEGALWDRDRIDELRVERHPELVAVVVAVDPAASSGSSSDDTGIIAAGLGVNGHGYVLADRTCHLPPNGWGHRAVNAYHEHEADRIVGEVNNGGEMVEHVLTTVDDTVPFKSVHASRGKQTRAQPISSLYEQGKVHHVGGFPELEDEQCTWVPGDKSPDRMDAVVWALTDLMLSGQLHTADEDTVDPGLSITSDLERLEW
jgi:phage terminase large subunit-like protein